MSRDGSAAVAALRELRVELEVRRAELSVLEHAHDILERRVDGHEDRCDAFHPEKPCYGQTFSRWCRQCGHVIVRCEQHGGIRSATYFADLHRADHGGEAARHPEAGNARGVSRGVAPVPVGGVSTSPSPRGLRSEASQARRQATDVDSTQHSEPEQRRATSGPGVIRRGRRGQGVDR